MSEAQWVMQIACELQGCAVKHADDGEFGLVRDGVPPKGFTPAINGHAARILTRTVVYGQWVATNTEEGAT